MENLLQVGVITTTHGVRGEVKVFPTTDDAARFKKLKQVILDTGKKKDLYHWINAVYLTIFIALFLLLPQKFNLTVLPLALGLLVNAVSHVLVYKNR